MPDPLFSEQGLLGIAFDPNYATNGYFYVNYTGADNSLNVRRFRVHGDPATSNVADPNSGHTILHIPKQASWHNGGWIGFGPNDGYLYITTGDPGGGHAQLISSNLHGKILRIDVRSDAFPDDPMRNYAVPPSNPFVGSEGLDEVWAYGLRNPWRASFDRETGDLWINDVGELAREEVNFQPADSTGGENYGWPHREGTIPTSWPGPPNPPYVDPVYDYSRDDPDPLMAGAVVAASGLYRGPVAEFVGHYLFTDFASGNIWKLDPDALDPRASVTNINHGLVPNAGAISRIASFGEDAAGNLYLMDYDVGSNGEVFRIATTSQQSVWNGSDTAAGAAGDGTSWGDARNWTRGGSLDTPFAEHDEVVFIVGESPAVINLGADRTAAAVTFAGPYVLQGHTLRLMSGNVTVEDGVTAVSALQPGRRIRRTQHPQARQRHVADRGKCGTDCRQSRHARWHRCGHSSHGPRRRNRRAGIVSRVARPTHSESVVHDARRCNARDRNWRKRTMQIHSAPILTNSWSEDRRNSAARWQST